MPKRGTGSRSESGSRFAGPRRKKTTQKRARRPVEDDYEEYDSYEDEYDDDSYEDYDEGRSGGGGRSRSGRSSGRSAKRSRSGGTKHKLQTGLLVVAISTCFYAAGYAAIVFIKLLVLFDSASSGSVSVLGKGHLWLNFLGITGMAAGYIVCLLGPDKGSRNLNIAALATGVIAVGLVFFMQILPALDDGGSGSRELMRRFLALGFIGGSSLWESIFKQLLLEALLLSHLVLFLLAVRQHTSKRLDPSCSFYWRCGSTLQSALIHRARSLSSQLQPTVD